MDKNKELITQINNQRKEIDKLDGKVQMQKTIDDQKKIEAKS